MTTLFIISAAIFLIYTALSVHKFDVPKSLSDTYYLWKGYAHNFRWLFSAAMLGTALPLMPVFVDYSTESTTFIAFFCCAGLAYVGVACQFKMGLTKPVHFTSAGICATCAILWSLFNLQSGWVVVALSGVIFGLIALKRQNERIFWLEMGAFAIAYISLGLKIF